MPLKSKILRITCLSLLIQIALSAKLWFGTARSFPELSVLPFLSSISTLFSYALVVALVMVSFFPIKKTVQLALLSTLVLAVLSDINRLQPWVWFYVILIVLCFLEKEERAFFKVFIFFLAGFYLWSGLNKLNIWYASSEFPWFLEVVKPMKWLSHQRWFSFGTALFEASLGLALIFPKTRKGAIVGLLIFHFHILTLLSPFGHNWNQVVWPWNVALMAFLVLVFLFKDKNKPEIKNKYSSSVFLLDILKINSGKWILATVFLLPLLGFFGFFEKNMAFYLYTGMNSEVTLFWDKKQTTSLAPTVFDKSYERVGIEERRLQLDDWAMQELHVPPYNSLWAQTKMAELAIERYLPKQKTTGFFTLEVARWDKEDLKTATFKRPDAGF